MPSVDDVTLPRIRTSRECQAAIWLARIANVVLLPTVIWAVAGLYDVFGRGPR